MSNLGDGAKAPSPTQASNPMVPDNGETHRTLLFFVNNGARNYSYQEIITWLTERGLRGFRHIDRLLPAKPSPLSRILEGEGKENSNGYIG